ncbi:MAG: bifunctional 4-hydroxy-2-oxoglutarate aldolase/2-dehydro-3-deoxy-phosphogluconate aldolase [Deltaproteobacteria bacterium]|jgi:2-dehydro-3-deoxyphosphogluconate aldolase / (4S)-4-hydroxy-2-oxoglutarate aldolase|nr:bifunctional 4-hydroxy-2-oxoglutarate aldolase/2-dehydro-3-deoxy-phosphogluconate aldolase [Deltaproteobacteria bacterium]MBT6436216.1 bifunctional 4-hydroxy-2-oxoglutarate aldolase/2-dehydro-3-deoxy-phosphogluconate aldolase [Deltaproteobacteria bacterium]
MSRTLEILQKAPILPVLVIERIEDAVPLARALAAGGLPVLEVTLRTGVALEAIKRIKDEVEGVYCGAGTVTHGRMVEALEEVSADFAVSPGYTMSLGDALRLSRIPLLPGVATASELMVCLDRGYSCFKFFPAEANGGTKMLKAFGGPFPDAKFCPTGGITPSNLKSYLDIPSVVTAGGSWIAPKDAIERKDWDFITAEAERVVALVND